MDLGNSQFLAYAFINRFNDIKPNLFLDITNSIININIGVYNHY